ncbi:MAG TPA: phospholipase D-like domain-containing protein, partial [Polyangiaceae bacterium]|nr:phospholipase D-like domain-containing protein [Polyangiaceae bacterium]
EYQASMMHAKSMLIDSELSLIGSINLDPLSLHELEEGALVTRDPGVNEHLARDFLEDTHHARELAPER